ncbi:unnamed protein product [Candidula unifasciata]|uniref:Uncharacterized protein n=1 Tax=Candidula unifasciata TaxID=100452 RepID=A0A8S4A089_9EUPU|nr:unnamed protein product [Candidula unifasciata]
MQPSKTPDSSIRRKLSGTGPGGALGTSELSTSNVSAAATSVSSTQPSVVRSTSGSSTQPQNAAAGSVYKASLVLTPVSQISRGPRRTSRHEALTGEHSSSFDPEVYNPDGSLRTVHKLPSFDQSYADARNTRYIRHRERSENEKELSVDQIFEKKEHC